jgi:hypothetical protein
LDLRRYLGAGRERVQAMAAQYIALTGAVGRSGAGVAAAARGRGAGTAPDWTAHDEEPE